MMPHWFARLFDIRRDEWGRVVLLSTMLFLTNVGTIWGLLASEAAFLKSVGTQQQSLFQSFVIMGNAVGGVLVTALYTAFADRRTNTALLLAILLGSSGLFALGLGLQALGWETAAYVHWYILTLVFIDIFFNLHWATYVNDFYDTQTAKRLFPIIAAAARVAAIVAGFSIQWLNAGNVSTSTIILIFIGLQLFVALLAWQLPRLTRATLAPSPSRGQAQSFLANMREGYHYVWQSPFLRWLAVATFLIYVIFALLTDQTNRILNAQLSTAAEISNTTGLLNTAGNLLIFPIMLFGLGRLITWLGVGNASLIFPLGTLGIINSIAFMPGLISAGLAHFDRFAFRVGFHLTLDGLLFNAVPVRVKGRARAFMGGLVVPAGTICGGLLVIALSFIPAEVRWPTLVVLLTLGLAYVASMLLVRQQYGQALIRLLEQENFSALLTAGAADVAVADPITLSLLKTKLTQSPNRDLATFTTDWLLQLGGAQAVPFVISALPTLPAEWRASLLTTLAEANVRHPLLPDFYRTFLTAGDLEVRLAALNGLQQYWGLHSENFLALAETQIRSPDLEVRAHVLPPLLTQDETSRHPLALQTLRALLGHPQARYRAKGVRILGQIITRLWGAELLAALEDSAAEVRLTAVQVLMEARLFVRTMPQATALFAKLNELLTDPAERVREVALYALCQLTPAQLTQHQLRVVLTDPSLHVRETAVETLAPLGRPLIPTLHPTLSQAPAPTLAKMATATLSRIAPREFSALVETQLAHNLREIYHNLMRLATLTQLPTTRGLRLWQSLLRDTNQQLLAEIFYLLSTQHAPKTVQVVYTTLGHGDARQRANAAEALETITSPQTARLLAPLFTPELLPEALMQLARTTWNFTPPNWPTLVEEALQPAQAEWLRSIVLYNLGEQSALPPAEKSEPVASTEHWLHQALQDASALVREAAQAGQRLREHAPAPAALSAIEKMVFLKEVVFFQGMTVAQLATLVQVCEEVHFEAETTVYQTGDPGGALYVVVTGKVALEREKQRKGSVARLGTLETYAYFGEMNLFDNSARNTSAMTLQPTRALCLRQAPVLALIEQSPDLAVALLKVLSQRLRDTANRIGELSRTKATPNLNQFFNKLDA